MKTPCIRNKDTQKSFLIDLYIVNLHWGAERCEKPVHLQISGCMRLLVNSKQTSRQNIYPYIYLRVAITQNRVLGMESH